jgi:hypothetical protein
MPVCGGWHTAASISVLAPLWRSAVVRWWRSSSVIVTTWRWPLRTTIPASVHRAVVVAVATVMRPLRIPFVGTHSDSASGWSRWHVRLLFLASSARVEFVTVLVPWQVFGSGWYRMDLEVLMLQCVKCVDALFVVQAQQAFQEIKTFWLEVLSKALVDITPLLLPFLDSFAARQGRPARHVRFVW